MKWRRNGQIFAGRLAIDGRVSFIAGEPPADLARLGRNWNELFEE